MIVKYSLIGLQQLLKSRLEYYQQKMKLLPTGELQRKTTRGVAYYFYIDNNGHRQSLLKNSELKQKLFLREKYIRLIQTIDENVATMQRCIDRYIPSQYSEIPFDSLEMRRDELYDGNLRHTVKAKKYRSKSEAIIAMILDELGLEFIYEPIIKISEGTYYSDFAIKRPSDSRVIYLEHFGMIKLEKYSMKTSFKIELYRKIGITLWDNFIITFDDADGAIDVSKIKTLIEHYCL